MTTSAYTCGPGYGGETADIIAELCGRVTSSAITIQNTRVNTGSFGLLAPLATNAQKAIAFATDGQSLTALQGMISFFTGFVGLSAQPNSGQLCWVSDGVQDTTRRYIRFGDAGASDTRVRIYDQAGNFLGASSGAISTSSLTELIVCVDCLTNPTVYVHIYIGNAYDSGFDTGVTPANFWGTSGALVANFGEWLSAGNRGADLYFDDATARVTTSASLAPHLTAFPRLRIYGGKQFSASIEGNSIQWTGFAESGLNAPVDGRTPNTWKDIAATFDLLGTTNPGHDGDVSGWDVSAQNQKHLVRWGDGTAGFVNPVAGLTIDSAYQTFVGRLTGVGKTGCRPLWRLNGNELTYVIANTLTTTFGGNMGIFTSPGQYDNDRPGGGAFAAADFGLRVDNYSEFEFGLQSEGSGTVSMRATELPGPTVAAYSATLPKAPMPNIYGGIWVPTSQPIFEKAMAVAY